MFNEKIIEKNRPLEPDMYFKNYAQNKFGEPTKGYRSSGKLPKEVIFKSSCLFFMLA
jgi:hypothetical protein